MKLDLSIAVDLAKAKTHFKALCERQCKIEIKEVRKKRTLDQNAYWHVCCAVLGDYAGYTVHEVKNIIKSQLEFMQYKKGEHTFYKSSAILSKAEFADLIEFTRSFGDQHGCYIPTAEEYDEKSFEMERELNHMM